MKFTIAAVAAAIAALSLAGASPAAGQTSGLRSPDKSAPVPQITGARLQAGLLPASAFGPDFTVTNTLNTGTKLESTRVTLQVPTASCSTFEGEIYVSGFGNTAGAVDLYVNADASTQRPEAIIHGFQDVIQFAAASAATTFFNQAQAKYAACPSFSEPNPTDTSPGGGAFQISTLSVFKTAVGGDQAFTVTQEIALSETPGQTKYIDVLYAVTGTNVYSMWQESGTNDEPSPTLMAQLIRKIQALYPH
jgi:hypothetical protein